MGRAEFSADGAAPERIYVKDRGELGRRDFRIEPRMVTPDMTNTHTANAQFFHHRNPVNARKFWGSTSIVSGEGVGAPRRPSAATPLFLRTVREKPFVGLSNPIPQRNRWLPTKSAQFRDGQKLSRCAIRFGGVPGKLAIKTNHVANQLSQFTDREVFAAPNIDNLR